VAAEEICHESLYSLKSWREAVKKTDLRRRESIISVKRNSRKKAEENITMQKKRRSMKTAGSENTGLRRSERKREIPYNGESGRWKKANGFGEKLSQLIWRNISAEIKRKETAAARKRNKLHEALAAQRNESLQIWPLSLYRRNDYRREEGLENTIRRRRRL